MTRQLVEQKPAQREESKKMIHGTTHHRPVLSPTTPPEWTVLLSEVSFRLEKLKNDPHLLQDLSTSELIEAGTMTSPL